MLGAAGRTTTTYLYNEGVGGDDWVEGWYNKPLPADVITLSKEADHLSIYVESNGTATTSGTWVTDSPVDLTDYNTLSIQWQGIDVYNGILVVSTVKMASGGTYDARLDAYNSWNTTSELDVSALEGEHYIRIHLDSKNTAGAGEQIKAYKVWLE
jgi:hypothetical protein